MNRTIVNIKVPQKAKSNAFFRKFVRNYATCLSYSSNDIFESHSCFAIVAKLDSELTNTGVEKEFLNALFAEESQCACTFLAKWICPEDETLQFYEMIFFDYIFPESKQQFPPSLLDLLQMTFKQLGQKYNRPSIMSAVEGINTITQNGHGCNFSRKRSLNRIVNELFPTTEDSVCSWLLGCNLRKCAGMVQMDLTSGEITVDKRNSGRMTLSTFMEKNS